MNLLLNSHWWHCYCFLRPPCLHNHLVRPGCNWHIVWGILTGEIHLTLNHLCIGRTSACSVYKPHPDFSVKIMRKRAGTTHQQIWYVQDIYIYISPSNSPWAIASNFHSPSESFCSSSESDSFSSSISISVKKKTTWSPHGLLSTGKRSMVLVSKI